MNNIDFVFVGKHADFTSVRKYLETKGVFKALHFVDENLPLLSQEDSVLLKSIDEICDDSSNYFNSNTLIIASSLYSSSYAIFYALDKASSLFLLDYKDISIDDTTKLKEYSKNTTIALNVPIFSHSKSILIKKMMGMYTTNKHITMSVNDVENDMFESELFLLSLNLVGKENIHNIEIKKSDHGISIITSEYNIDFNHIYNKEHSFINMNTKDKSWYFEWEILDSLNIYHANGVKENYSHSKENNAENVYRNVYLNCIGSTNILYTTIEDIELYTKIKEAFYGMGENSSTSISL